MRLPETGGLGRTEEKRGLRGFAGPLLLIVLGLFRPALLTAGEPPYYVDLSALANTNLEDDGIANNGKGGWTDEGINDLYLYPPLPLGKNSYRGYPFHVLDPKKNHGKSVLILRGQKRCQDKPLQAEAKVASVKGKYVYFLQQAAAAVRAPKNYVVAVYTVRYADGSQEEIAVRDGLEIHQWWSGNWWENKEELRWPVHMGRNVYTRKWGAFIGLWATRWVNPHPGKPITAVAFRSRGKAVPIILAVTISNQDYAARRKQPGNKVRKPPPIPEGYFDAKFALENKMVFKAMLAAGHVKGVRRVDLIRRDVLAVTVDAALGRIGAGPGEKTAAGFQKADTFRLTSDSDPNYRGGAAPLKVGRHSFEFWNGPIGPFPQNVLYWHTYYLFLPKPLASGHAYTVTVRGIGKAFKRSGSIHYDEARTVTPVIKVNQVAYSSKSARRFAYLGWWAGDAGKIGYAELKTFQVLDEKTGRTAWRGNVRPRKADDKLSGEDVYELDLSALKPGRYHVRIPGLGRSNAFGVGGPGLRGLYFHTLRAFYHQRCGQELKQPYTTFEKPACHLESYESGYLVTNRDHLPKPGEKKRRFRGGYHDAADFDCFTYHLRATAQMLDAYEWAPKQFRDGDLSLPESGNGVPDVLDEADWALFFYRDQQRADGAVPLGRGNDQDAIRDWERKHGGKRPPYGIFPPSSTASTEFAAVAARYARLIRSFDQAKAKSYLQAARRAYAWAKSNLPAGQKKKAPGTDLFLGWAASELYAATGDASYNQDFKRLFEQGAMTKLHWNLTQVAPICLWPYATCSRPGVDKAIQEKLRALILRRADEVIKQTESSAYRMGHGDRGGLGWGNGNGGGFYADPCLRAYKLSRKQKYLDAACVNADFQLGANPLSKTFITGLGARPPRHPQISAFLYTGPHKTGTTVKGITVYGLAGRQPGGHPKEAPLWRRWRDLGNGGAEVSSEFTITQTIGASAMLYSLLYVLEQP